ncbi:MAG: ACT domain-containing protein [Candidatus Sulfotelmatobacter sp.]
MRQALKFRQLPGFYGIIRLAPHAFTPDWATQGDFASITRTADELSIVCPPDSIPKELASGPRWICLKLEGPFPFSQTGVLLSFMAPLSKNAIPICAISTYDTHYVLVEEEFGSEALRTLDQAGHKLVGR